MVEDVILSIGGHKYGGWEEVEIVRSLDSLTGGFSLTAAARADGKDVDFQFKAGAAVKLSIGNELLITGWADTVRPAFEGTSHSIEIVGRDRASDLIDCSAVHTPGSWTNARIEDIAAELAKPFGIAITAKTSTGERLKRFALQQGESVFEAIERMLRYRGLLAISTPGGDVEIIARKQSGIDLRIDRARMLTAEAVHDVSERFSQYIVKGQASGDDESSGKAVSKVRGEASDPAVDRHRPLIIIGEEQSTISALDKRAKWEATTRAGKAQGATLTMQGWRDSDTKLYVPNSIIELREPRLFIDSPMLVTEVTLRKGADGTTAALSCAPPEAWSQMEIPEEREASKVKKGGKS